MRRFFMAAALGAAVLAMGAPSVQADKVATGGEGCIATTPGSSSVPAGNLVYSGFCSYVATRTGGYATAAQGWSVKVFNNASPTKALVAEYNSANGSKPCNTSPVIQRGHYVEVRASGSGIAAAGNPFLEATDGTQPAASDGCARLP